MPESSKNRKKNLLYFAPAFSWGIFISIVTLLPSESLPKLAKDANDKLLHASVYFLFTFLLYLGFSSFKIKSNVSPSTLWLVLIGSTIHGVIIEFLQHYVVKGRTGDWQDFIANTLGASLALVILLYFKRK